MLVNGIMREENLCFRLRASWGIYSVLLIGWTLFSYGFFLYKAHPQFPSIRPIGSWGAVFLAHSPLALLALTGLLWFYLDRWRPWLTDQLESHTNAIDALPSPRIGVWIAAAAGVGLFAELMVIRLHSSYFPLFAYFKNVSLLSCFLGLGIGYTLASRRLLLTPFVMPALTLQILTMHFLRFAMVGGLQNPVAEEASFGVPTGDVSQLIAAYGFMVVFFGFNALAFVPLGQLASRLMAR